MGITVLQYVLAGTLGLPHATSGRQKRTAPGFSVPGTCSTGRCDGTEPRSLSAAAAGKAGICITIRPHGARCKAISGTPNYQPEIRAQLHQMLQNACRDVRMPPITLHDVCCPCRIVCLYELLQQVCKHTFRRCKADVRTLVLPAKLTCTM